MKKGKTIKRFSSYSGFEIKEVYSKEDLPNNKTSNLEKDSKLNSWDFHQSTSAGNPEKINSELLFLTKHGHTSLSLDFDEPTLLGNDSDDLKSRELVGKTGVPIDTIEDLEIVLQNIPIEKLSITLESDYTAPILYAMFILISEKRKIPLKKLRGSVRNDILNGVISNQKLLFPLQHSLKLLTDTVEYITKTTPSFCAINTQGTRAIYPEITATQEIAFSLSKTETYINSCIAHGLDIDDFSDKISFTFHTKSDFFEEIAKYRAARNLWHKLISTNLQAKEEKSKFINFNAKCEPINLVSTQLENNLVRIAFQVMASSYGGANSITCGSFDKHFSKFNENNLLLAIRTQQILLEETGLSNSENIFSGSYFVENLTQQISNEVMTLSEEINSNGGIIFCIEKGILQKWSLKSRMNLKNKIKAGEHVILGLNKYLEESEEKKSFPIHPNQKETEKTQIKRLVKIKNDRDPTQVTEGLEKLEKSAKSNENLIPSIMHAIKLHATIGEIVTSLKKIWGNK